MNSIALTHRDLSRALSRLADEPRDVVAQRLVDSIKRYRNDDSLSRSIAIRAVLMCRAAFWTTANYHSARAVDLPNAMNLGMPIMSALDEAYPDHLPEKLRRRLPALDTLVPLNRPAVEALSGAYRLFGTWREPAELEARRAHEAWREQLEDA